MILSFSMMDTIAITNWNNIVSPLYDASCYLTVITSDGQREVIHIRDFSLYERAELCTKKNVQILICGAISNDAYALLRNRGIKVFSWTRGPVDELISACQKKISFKDNYYMPGCKRKRCTHHRHRRRRGSMEIGGIN